MYDWKNAKKSIVFPPVLRLENSRPPGLTLKLRQRLPPPQPIVFQGEKKTPGTHKKTSRLLFSRSGVRQKTISNTWKNMCCLVVVGTWNAPIFYQNSYHVFFALTATQTHATPAFLHCSHLQGTLGFLLHVFVFSAGSHWRYRWWFRHPGKNNHLGWEVKTPVVKKMGISSTRSTPKDGFCWTKIPGKKHLDWLVVGFWHPFETYFLSNWFNIFSLIFRGWTFQKIVEKPPPDVDVDRMWCGFGQPTESRGWPPQKQRLNKV